MTDKYKVLVVDDNDVNATISAEMLNSFELESSIAVSGKEAIKMVGETDYAFVLMDYIMPEMDGVETTRKIREFSKVPIYAMTADNDGKAAADFFAAGASATISKPPKATELLKIIRKCVPASGFTVNEALFKNDEDEYPATLDSSAKLLESFMGMVEGLNYAKGLVNAGNITESYLRLLKASSVDIRDYVKTLSLYLRTGDPAQLKYASHSLKIVFSNIGFEGLQAESERIEVRAADLLKDSEISGSIPSFNAAHQEIVNDYISHTLTSLLELEDAVESYEKSIAETAPEEELLEPVHPLSEEELKEVFEYTENAIRRFEIDYCLEGLGILRDAFIGEDRKKAEAALEAAGALDYVGAEEILEDLKNLKMGRGEAR